MTIHGSRRPGRGAATARATHAAPAQLAAASAGRVLARPAAWVGPAGAAGLGAASRPAAGPVAGLGDTDPAATAAAQTPGRLDRRRGGRAAGARPGRRRPGGALRRAAGPGPPGGRA